MLVLPRAIHSEQREISFEVAIHNKQSDREYSGWCMVAWLAGAGLHKELMWKYKHLQCGPFVLLARTAAHPLGCGRFQDFTGQYTINIVTKLH